MASESPTSLPAETAPEPCRKFGLLDGMILLAGAAVALGEGAHLFVFLAQYCTHLFFDIVIQGADLFTVGPVFGPAVRSDLRDTLWYGLQVGEMILFGMTPALLILRLRKPRPAVRSLPRQPGFVASLAMVFGLFWGTGFLVSAFPERFDSVVAAPTAVGASVALAWAVLALTRTWRCEPGWIDRSGRILGCTAIVIALLPSLFSRI